VLYAGARPVDIAVLRILMPGDGIPAVDEIARQSPRTEQ